MESSVDDRSEPSDIDRPLAFVVRSDSESLLWSKSAPVMSEKKTPLGGEEMPRLSVIEEDALQVYSCCC